MIGDAEAILSWYTRLRRAPQLTPQEHLGLLELLCHLYAEEVCRNRPPNKGRHPAHFEHFYAAAELAILTEREPDERKHQKITGTVAENFGWKDSTLLRYRRDHHEELSILLADPHADRATLLEIAQTLHKRSG